MKGDWVEIVIDAGDGARTYEVTARRAGRRVDIATRRGVIEVSEVTRSGTPVRTARFMASRILALVEHPAGEPVSDRTRPLARADSATPVTPDDPDDPATPR
ncbi:MAG TPA: hypothetical protein VGH27_28620 [Streptosporangiaceae bacterium]